MHCVMSIFSAGAGVGAAQAHLRAIHQVMDGIAERLVDVALHIRVQGDHLANGHSGFPYDFLWRTGGA